MSAGDVGETPPGLPLLFHDVRLLSSCTEDGRESPEDPARQSGELWHDLNNLNEAPFTAPVSASSTELRSCVY